MRTTIRLPDQLYGQVRERSATEGTTVTSFIQRALRAALSERGQAPAVKFEVVPLPQRGGTQPGVDLSDSDALLDLLNG